MILSEFGVEEELHRESKMTTLPNVLGRVNFSLSVDASTVKSCVTWQLAVQSNVRHISLTKMK